MENINWVVRNGLMSLYEKRTELFARLALLAFLFLVVSTFQVSYLNDLLYENIIVFILFILESLILAFIAINIHRVLLSSDRLNLPATFSLSYAESNMRYLIRAVWIFFIVSLILLLISLLASPFITYDFNLDFLTVIAFIVFVWAIYFIVPVFLVLPCVAYRDVLTFKGAFEIGRDYRLMLFVVVMVLPILSQVILTTPLDLISNELSLGEGAHLNDESRSIITIAYVSLVNLGIAIFSVALLSAAYARIKMQQEPE